MEVGRAVRTQLGEVVGAAIVLVDEDRLAVEHHERRVAARAVGDRRTRPWMLTRTPGAISISSVSTVRTNSRKPRSASVRRCTGREIGQQDRDVPRQVRRQPRCVVVVTVEMRHVEEVGRSMRSTRSSSSWSLRGQEPRPEEGRHEPGSHRIETPRLDQPARVTEGSHAW